MAFDSSKTIYKPGQMVPRSGIYKVLHAEHRSPHRASFKAQEKFPLCSQCASHVRFELVLAAKEEEESSGNIE
jgi:hypothetical protein